LIANTDFKNVGLRMMHWFIDFDFLSFLGTSFPKIFPTCQKSLLNTFFPHFFLLNRHSASNLFIGSQEVVQVVIDLPGIFRPLDGCHFPLIVDVSCDWRVFILGSFEHW
jgi:hypothetical protein